MPASHAEVLPTPESIAAYVKKNAPAAKMGSMGPVESVRVADYQGHHITVRTTYQIDVDGRPVTGHIDLSNDGSVAYHGLPNMSFDSAIDLVKKLIDHFPEDFQPGARKGDMGGMSGMSGMAGMKKKRAPAKKKSAAAKKSRKSK